MEKGPNKVIQDACRYTLTGRVLVWNMFSDMNLRNFYIRGDHSGETFLILLFSWSPHNDRVRTAIAYEQAPREMAD